MTRSLLSQSTDPNNVIVPFLQRQGNSSVPKFQKNSLFGILNFTVCRTCFFLFVRLMHLSTVVVSFILLFFLAGWGLGHIRQCSGVYSWLMVLRETYGILWIEPLLERQMLTCCIVTLVPVLYILVSHY